MSGPANTAAAITRNATRTAGAARDDSSRSPAMVSARKAIHQGTAGKPASRDRLPTSQASAPPAGVAFARPGWRRHCARLAAKSTAAAAAISTKPSRGRPSARSTPARPAHSGAAYAQARPSATARSSEISVPKNADTISGPCSASVLMDTGSGVSRASPPAMPRPSDTTAKRSSVARTSARLLVVAVALVPVAVGFGAHFREHRGVRILPFAAGGARHVGGGAREIGELQVALAAFGRHVARSDPGMRGDYVLAFLEQRRPGLAVAELRRLVEFRRVAYRAYLAVHLLAGRGARAPGDAPSQQEPGEPHHGLPIQWRSSM